MPTHYPRRIASSIHKPYGWPSRECDQTRKQQQEQEQYPTAWLWHGTCAGVAGPGSELDLPEQEVLAVDDSVSIGIPIGVHRSAVRELSESGLPDEEIGSVDIAVLVEVALQRTFNQLENQPVFLVADTPIKVGCDFGKALESELSRHARP